MGGNFKILDVETFFPFHFCFDESLHCIHFGKSLLKIIPDTNTPFKFHELFAFVRPVNQDIDFHNLTSCTEKLVILKCLFQESVFLRGQFIYDAANDKICFIGNIWIKDTKTLETLELKFSDFSFTDSLPDMLLLLNTFKKSNEELIDLNNRFSENEKKLYEKSYMADNFFHPLVIVNRSGEVEWSNKAFINISRETKNEFAGKIFTDLFCDELNMETFNDLIRQSIQSGKNIKYELNYLNQTKEINWVELEIQPIRNYKEKIEKFIIVIKNISIEKRYQLQLKKSEEEYKYIIDNISEVIFQTDTKGNWIFLNNAWVEIMGYSLQESLNTLFFNYLFPDDVEKNALLFGPLIRKEKEDCRHAIRYVTKNGSIKWMQVFAKLLFNDSNELIGTTGTLKDITNDMQYQHFSNVLLNNINDIICIFNKEGVFKYISPSFFKVTGYLEQDIHDKKIFELVHPKDVEQISHSFMELQMKRPKEGFYDNFRIRYANGTYKWIELNSNIFIDEFYVEELIVASAREINQRKKTELEMIGTLKKQKELNELKSQFVQMTSHEFRNPLAIIKSSVELMEYYLQPDKSTDKNVFDKHTRNIKKEVERLTYLMNEILTYGKIENDAIKLKPLPVLLSTFIQNIINRNIDKIFSGRGILLEVGENEKMVNIDPILMEHIVDNLVTNALKYSEGKKDPVITINFQKTYFELIVKDFGIGIAPKDIIKLFTPFHRGSNVGLIKGTGMGLAIARKFIELHRGSIKCESAVGSGTCFIVKMEYL